MGARSKGGAREGAVFGGASGSIWGQSWRSPHGAGKVKSLAGISEIQRSQNPGLVQGEGALRPLRPFPRLPLSSSQPVGECRCCCSASCPPPFHDLSEQVRSVGSAPLPPCHPAALGEPPCRPPGGSRETGAWPVTLAPGGQAKSRGRRSAPSIPFEL